MPYIDAMKRFASTLALVAVMASPLSAQQDGDGLSLMDKGARMFLRGLMAEMEPALKDLESLAQEMGPALDSFVAQMGPALRDLLGQVDDWSVYEAPEILPNGDIIIRRKPDAPDTPAKPQPEQGPEIEL